MTSLSTSQEFTDRVISLFLYGEDERPDDIADKRFIRAENTTTSVEINEADYLINGPGRFARASFFELVQRFLIH